jgi:hypothetical protein
MKSLLAAQEQANPRLFKCVLSALRSLMAVGLENTQDAAPEARLAIVGQ